MRWSMIPALWSLTVFGALTSVGCQQKPPPTSATGDADAEIRVVLAALSPTDQLLAESQRYCPVMPEARLGEMGPPVKILLQGETFFVCCNNCENIAREDPGKTLARVKELRHVLRKTAEDVLPSKKSQ